MRIHAASSSVIKGYYSRRLWPGNLKVTLSAYVHGAGLRRWRRPKAMASAYGDGVDLGQEILSA